MKKFICIMLCIVGLLSVSVSADTMGRVYINDVSAKAGDGVVVSVMAEYISSCSGGSVNIVYDQDLLELVSCTQGDAMDGATLLINEAYAENTIRLNWMTSSALADGSICDVEFKVKDDADQSAFIKIEGLKLSDIEGNVIDATAQGGYVIIGEGSLVVTDMRILDFENNEIVNLTAGSNNVHTQIHNTLNVEARPLIIYALYKKEQLVSTGVKMADTKIAKNETVTIEGIVNVPFGTGYKLEVIVWDGVLNVKSIEKVSFVSE